MTELVAVVISTRVSSVPVWLGEALQGPRHVKPLSRRVQGMGDAAWDSSRCRATIPVHVGPVIGVSETEISSAMYYGWHFRPYSTFK